MFISTPIGYMTIGLSVGAAVAWGLVWYFARHPETVQKWGSVLLWFFAWLVDRWDYYAITWEVQGKLNSFVRNLGRNTIIDFPQAKIQWAGKDNSGVQWEDHQVIIVMRNREHRNKNLVHAAQLFVSEMLLRKSKKHLSKTQKTSMDLYATKKVLETQSAAAVEQFIDDYLSPSIEANNEIRNLIGQYLKIDKKGVFFPILINELIVLGGKVFLEKPTAEVILEVKFLVDFLEKFADREDSSDAGSREFVGRYIRCVIRIVASRETRERGDVGHHKEGILAYFKRGLENVYLVGMSNPENKEFIEAVAGACIEENDLLECVKRYDVPGLVIRRGREPLGVATYLLHLHNPKAVKYLYEKNEI